MWKKLIVKPIQTPCETSYDTYQTRQNLASIAKSLTFSEA